MIKILSIGILSLVCCMATSCGSTRFLVSDLNPKDIDSIHVLKPVVMIFQGEDSGRQSRSPALSNLVTANILSGLPTTIPAGTVIRNVALDSTQQPTVDALLYIMMDEMKNQNRLIRFRDDNRLYRLLDSLRISYAIGIFDIGMTTKSLLEAPENKSTSLQFAYSDMSCVILDMKRKNVALYSRIKHDMQEPCVKELNVEQLREMLEPYFKTSETTAK